MRRLTLLASLIAVAGCATIARQMWQEPKVTLNTANVRALGFNGATIDVVLDVENPNEYRVDASRITYRFFVDTTQVVTGQIDSLITLESQGKSQVVVPITFGYRETAAALRGFMASGTLNYRVAGEFTLKTLVGQVTLPYSGSGKYQAAR